MGVHIAAKHWIWLRLHYYLEAAFLDQYVRQSPLNLFSRRSRFRHHRIRRRITQREVRDLHAAAGRDRTNACGRASILENRNIAALAQHDPDSILAPFGAVILVQLIAQPARLHADNGVHPRVKSLPPIEHLKPDKILLQPMRLAEETFFHHKLQETADAVRLYECAATQDKIQLRTNLSSGNAVQNGSGLFDGVYNCRHHLNSSTPNPSNSLHGSFKVPM